MTMTMIIIMKLICALDHHPNYYLDDNDEDFGDNDDKAGKFCDPAFDHNDDEDFDDDDYDNMRLMMMTICGEADSDHQPD